VYNSKMVVKLLGLSAGTIRAWETCYGVVDPVRSDGRHRLYSDQDVEDLRWLTSEKGISISQAAQTGYPRYWRYVLPMSIIKWRSYRKLGSMVLESC